jgi:hypothetical protein
MQARNVTYKTTLRVQAQAVREDTPSFFVGVKAIRVKSVGNDHDVASKVTELLNMHSHTDSRIIDYCMYVAGKLRAEPDREGS